jgi:hypothetical protein
MDQLFMRGSLGLPEKRSVTAFKTAPHERANRNDTAPASMLFMSSMVNKKYNQ